MNPAFREDLDRLFPIAAEGPGVILSPPCHAGAPVLAAYQIGAIWLACAICRTPILQIAVAETLEPLSPEEPDAEDIKQGEAVIRLCDAVQKLMGEVAVLTEKPPLRTIEALKQVSDALTELAK